MLLTNFNELSKFFFFKLIMIILIRVGLLINNKINPIKKFKLACLVEINFIYVVE